MNEEVKQQRLEASEMANEISVVSTAGNGRVETIEMVGAGRCVVPIEKVHYGGEQFSYRMQLLRIGSEGDGSLGWIFTARDVLDLPKLVQVLAATLVADGCLEQELKDDLDCLAATLDLVVGRPAESGRDGYSVLLREDLSEVVDYLWEDEKRHFEGVDEAERGGHIFRSLARLRRVLGKDEPR
jgi:hypothetical protein